MVALEPSHHVSVDTEARLTSVQRRINEIAFHFSPSMIFCTVLLEVTRFTTIEKKDKSMLYLAFASSGPFGEHPLD